MVVGLCLAVGDVRDEHPALGRHAELEALVARSALVASALFDRVDTRTVFCFAGCFRHGFLDPQRSRVRACQRAGMLTLSNAPRDAAFPTSYHEAKQYNLCFVVKG